MEKNQADSISELILKGLREEELTREEKKQLEGWINKSPAHKAFFDKVTNEENLSENIKFLLEENTSSFDNLWKELYPNGDTK